jgi:hypothetical protein
MRTTIVFGGIEADILRRFILAVQVWCQKPSAATVSKLAVITQTPKEFDFPIRHLPPQFHYAGPFHDNEGREPVPCQQ